MPRSTLRTFLLALTATWTLIWFLPRIAEKGLFADGLVYTTLAHNLSRGIGTAWAPVIRNGDYLYHPQDVFYDHPPLVFVLEATLYRLAGDHTEWIYNSLVLVLILWISAQLFRLMFPDRQARALPGFLPAFFLFLAPEWVKKVSYNLLDTTMALMAAMAVYAILRGVKNGRTDVRWLLAGGIGIAAACLAKGPVGLFPLAVPLICFLTPGMSVRWGNMVKATAWVMVMPALIGIALALHPPAYDFFTRYVQMQVLDSVTGQREAAGTLANHLGILVKIAEQTIVMAAAVLLIRWIRIRWFKAPFRGMHPVTILFLGIALSASLPIMVSAKHHSFYLYPALVFFALAAAGQVVAMVPSAAWQKRSRVYTVGTMASGAMLAALVVTVLLKEDRYYRTHADFLGAMDSLMADVPPGVPVAAPWEILKTRADVNGYLERYYQTVLTRDPRAADYYLSFHADSLPDGHVAGVTCSGSFRMVRWAASAPAERPAR